MNCLNRLPILVLTLSLVLGSNSRAQQPAPDASTNSTTPEAPAQPTYPPAASLTDAELVKELTDIGADIKTEGDAPDGAIIEITFKYTHTPRLSPTGLKIPPYPITDDLLARVSKLPKLTHLELNMCLSLTDAGFANLKGMTQLQALSLPGHIITDTTMGNIAGLTNLTYFRSTGSTKVTDAGWAAVENWKQIKTFWVAESGFNEAKMQHLKGLTQLEDLQFWGNPVGDTGYEVLLGLPNLKSVRFGLKPSGAEMAKLKAALPNCKFQN